MKEIIVIGFLLIAGVVNADEGMRFGQEQLDKHEGSSAYHAENKALLDSVKQLGHSPIFMEGRKQAEVITAKKLTAPFIEKEGKLADEKGVNLDVMLSRYMKQFNLRKGKDEGLADLLVFISFSQSKDNLKEIAQQVKAAEGQLVLRGLIDGSMRKTTAAMLALNKEGVRAIIHPKLFERFNIEAVPAFVVVDSSSYCAENKCTPLIDKIVGNVSLDYALNQFIASGDLKDISLKLLNKMREKL